MLKAVGEEIPLENITFSFDGQGSAIASSSKAYLAYVPNSGTIIGWSLFADQSGSVAVDIWKAHNAIPTIANSIVASAPPTLSSQQQVQSTTLTGWSTAVSQGDVVIVNINSAATITKLNGSLQVQGG